MTPFITDHVPDEFKFTVEICDKEMRSRKIVSSTIMWYELQQKIAEHLNVYLSSLHILYRLSTDSKKDLPYDLLSQHHLDTLITLLRPLIVPPLLANGCCSTCPMKPITVQVFAKGSEAVPAKSEGKVSAETMYCFSSDNFNSVVISARGTALLSKKSQNLRQKFFMRSELRLGEQLQMCLHV